MPCANSNLGKVSRAISNVFFQFFLLGGGGGGGGGLVRSVRLSFMI